jgi:hypothetical protein
MAFYDEQNIVHMIASPHVTELIKRLVGSSLSTLKHGKE